MNTIKTAVSLPAETFKKAEKIRKKMGKSRSELVADALAKMVKELETREAEEAYAAAYRAQPETAAESAEAASWLKAAPWSDDEAWEEPRAER